MAYLVIMIFLGIGVDDTTMRNCLQKTFFLYLVCETTDELNMDMLFWNDDILIGDKYTADFDMLCKVDIK